MWKREKPPARTASKDEALSTSSLLQPITEKRQQLGQFNGLTTVQTHVRLAITARLGRLLLAAHKHETRGWTV